MQEVGAVALAQHCFAGLGEDKGDGGGEGGGGGGGGGGDGAGG